jgi:hypothetical protein
MSITPMLSARRNTAITFIMGQTFIRTTRGTVIMAERTTTNTKLAIFLHLGCGSAVDCRGGVVVIADTHRDDGKCVVVRMMLLLQERHKF